MVTRRSFIKSSALISAGVVFSPSFVNYDKEYIGLQLYTVRDAMASDPKETLRKVSKIGYNSVEAAGYSGDGLFYNLAPKIFSQILKDNGLIIPSSHYRYGEDLKDGKEVPGTILHNWQKAVDDASSIGIKYMVCAYLSNTERGKIEHYKMVSENLNKAGEICKKSGIQLCYHNHDFEFIKENDQIPYITLLDSTDKDLVKMEMDMYWVTKAGYNPVDLFKAHPNRFVLWHVKDMAKTEGKEFTEVGNGIIDFKVIFAHAKEAGMKYFFVEEDKCPVSPFESISQSLSYIKANLV